MYNMFKSVIDNDRAAVVLCDLEHKIVYMNRAAADRYKKSGGEALIGKSVLSCHNENSRKIIKQVIAWFEESKDNNMIFAYKNEAENKDVYLVALRDEESNLIGYYEKHEYRNPESADRYDFSRSLV